MRTLLAVFTLLALARPALAAAELNGVTLDPDGVVRQELLDAAVASFAAHDATLFRDTALAVVDFAKPSAEQRFYIIDRATGAVESFLVAHGSGSDIDHDGYAESFSNVHGSHASSLGAYRVGARYHGSFGLALKMDGLDPSNDEARPRAIVLHAQWYVTPEMAARYGKLGRSWGCFVVDPALVDHVVARLEDGVFLFAGR